MYVFLAWNPCLKKILTYMQLLYTIQTQNLYEFAKWGTGFYLKKLDNKAKQLG